jgi:hypothetical protein
VKKVPGGDFTTVVATGRNGGWAFGTSAAGANPKPAAWRRSGSSWTLVPFPGERNGGPLVLLHWNGHRWSKVAGGLFGFGVQPVQPIISDGHGGLWIPMPGAGGQRSYLLHYAAGHLRVAALPGGTGWTSVDTVSRIPGTFEVLAGGFTHALNNPGVNDAGALLEYES